MYETRSPEVEVCALNPLHFLSGERQLLLIKTLNLKIREEERPGNEVAKQLKIPLP